MTLPPIMVRPPLRAGFALYMAGDGLTVVHRRKATHRVPLSGRCVGLPPEAVNIPDPPARSVDAVCEWPGCSSTAICSSGNFGGKMVCSEHFMITNGPDWSWPAICRGCGWRGTFRQTLAPRSDDVALLCPECREGADVDFNGEWSAPSWLGAENITARPGA